MLDVTLGAVSANTFPALPAGSPLTVNWAWPDAAVLLITTRRRPAPVFGFSAHTCWNAEPSVIVQVGSDSCVEAECDARRCTAQQGVAVGHHAWKALALGIELTLTFSVVSAAATGTMLAPPATAFWNNHCP